MHLLIAWPTVTARNSQVQWNFTAQNKLMVIYIYDDDDHEIKLLCYLLDLNTVGMKWLYYGDERGGYTIFPAAKDYNGCFNYDPRSR